VDPPEKEAEALALESVKLLVGWGVDINAQDTDGRNALDGARSLRYASVVQYLTDHGAKSDRPVQPYRPRPKF
ncbi:MAG TPA: ankyrin repeat domain-containing protein, partial [Bryobacteraceae bacterium]|nr:ankyrin repeat domain-containing protein [Bryobacteraceae bacterium]